MAGDARVAVPGWFWIVGIVALAFEAAGCTMYMLQMTMTPADFAALPPAQQQV